MEKITRIKMQKKYSSRLQNSPWLRGVLQSADSLKYPSKIIFGPKTINEIPQLISGKNKILVITGKSAKKNGLFEKIEKLLSNFQILHLCGVVSNEAPLESVDEIIEKASSFKPDAIIAIGGGSVIDASKAAAGIIANGGKTADYFYGSAKIAKKGLFFIAAPSTAGTGSEITENAVLSDKKTLTKKSIRSENLIPDVAIVDPELTFSCPPSLAADSGMDALVQAIESHVSPDANFATRALSLKAIKLLVGNLEKAINGEIPAKIAVSEGSLLSAMSFSQTGLGAVHGLAHPIGIKYEISHGRTCGILMRKIFKKNLEKIPKLYDKAAVACGFKNSEDFLKQLNLIASSIGIPANFAKYGFSQEDFPYIIKNCRSRSMERNPCSFSDDEIKSILEEFLA